MKWKDTISGIKRRDPDFKFSIIPCVMNDSAIGFLVSSLSESDMVTRLYFVVRLPGFSLLRFPHLENDGIYG